MRTLQTVILSVALQLAATVGTAADVAAPLAVIALVLVSCVVSPAYAAPGTGGAVRDEQRIADASTGHTTLTVPSSIQAAVHDASRPADDVARDSNRKPAETLAFAGIKRGDVVADYIANSGYFTRLLSNVVGSNGHVYAVELNEVITFPNVTPGYAHLKTWAQERRNVTVETVPASTSVRFPRKLDVFWISQNYHDLHDKFLGPRDLGVFNRQVYDALKPGGLYIVLDHSAAAGAPSGVTETLHRIDPETVKREVEAVGFELVAQSDLLANPDDPRTIGVFDKSIAGHTDQFILKFRKPLGAH